MPSSKNRVPVALLLNYDEGKDSIYLTASTEQEPYLAANGLYITLKKGSATETLLREKLTHLGIIAPASSDALLLDKLRESGDISKKDEFLLKALTRAESGGSLVIFKGAPAVTNLAVASFIASSGIDNRTTSIEPKGLDESETLYGTSLPNNVWLEAGKMEDMNVQRLMRSVIRMRPDYITINLHRGVIRMEDVNESYPVEVVNVGRTLVYRMDEKADVELALDPFHKRGLAAPLGLVHVAAGGKYGYRITSVDLLD